MKNKGQAIQVCVRMRPLLQPYEDQEIWEVDEISNCVFTTSNPYQLPQFNDISQIPLTALKERDIRRRYAETLGPQTFTFDHVYGPDSTTQQIYSEVCSQIVHQVLRGYNSTIFMYGQTTSGKTYTMLGTPELPGILPVAIRDIFSQLNSDQNQSRNIWVSYLEIYNESINDLLNPDALNLKIKENPQTGVSIQNLKAQQVWTFEHVIMLMNYGEEHRMYRETSIHEHSSRSHTIFKVFIETQQESGNGRMLYGSLYLVDLAGSERLNEFEVRQPDQMGETGHINKSLFVLANVINKLAEGKSQHIPYRDSKLTRILSQALGGNSLTSIICTISPASMNFHQTLSTLRFATRAKTVHNAPKLNEIYNEAATIVQYKQEIRQLREELKKTQNELLGANSFNSDLQTKLQKAQNSQTESQQSQSLKQISNQLQIEKQKRIELENELKTVKQQPQSKFIDEQKPQTYNKEANFFENLLFNIDTLASFEALQTEWVQQSKQLASHYSEDLQRLQQEYTLAAEKMASELLPDSFDKIQYLFQADDNLPANVVELIDRNMVFQDIQIDFSGIMEEMMSNQKFPQDQLFEQVILQIKERYSEANEFIERRNHEALELIGQHFDEVDPSNQKQKQKCLDSLKRQYEQVLENLEISFQESQKIFDEFDLGRPQEVYQTEKMPERSPRDSNLVAYFWGSGKDGRCGIGNELSVQKPSQILQDQPIGIINIDCGYHHSAAITKDGKLLTWGRGIFGQLGHGNNQNYLLPKQVQQLPNIIQVSCGWQHTIALSEDHRIYSWGYGDDGQLGHGDTDDLLSPKLLQALAQVQVEFISCGHSHSGAIGQGQLFMWGCNPDARLFMNTRKSQLNPVRIHLPEKVVNLALGVNHSAAITQDGSLYLSGLGQEGQLGFECDDYCECFQSKEFGSFNRAVQVQCGDCFTLVLDDSGQVWSSGKGTNGRLGHGNDNSIEEFQVISALRQVELINAGCRHAAAVTIQGDLYMWGFNFYEQLGLMMGDKDSMKPRKVDLQGVRNVSCGYFHTGALVEEQLISICNQVSYMDFDSSNEDLDQKLQKVQELADERERVLEKEKQNTMLEIEHGLAEQQSDCNNDKQDNIYLKQKYNLLLNRNKKKQSVLQRLQDSQRSLSVQNKSVFITTDSVDLHLSSVNWTYSARYDAEHGLRQRLMELNRKLIQTSQKTQDEEAYIQKLQNMKQQEKRGAMVMRERVEEIKQLHRRITKKVESVQSAKLTAQNNLIIMQNELNGLRRIMEQGRTEYNQMVSQKVIEKQWNEQQLEKLISDASKRKINVKEQLKISKLNQLEIVRLFKQIEDLQAFKKKQFDIVKVYSDKFKGVLKLISKSDALQQNRIDQAIVDCIISSFQELKLKELRLTTQYSELSQTLTIKNQQKLDLRKEYELLLIQNQNLPKKNQRQTQSLNLLIEQIDDRQEIYTKQDRTINEANILKQYSILLNFCNNFMFYFFNIQELSQLPHEILDTFMKVKQELSELSKGFTHKRRVAQQPPTKRKSFAGWKLFPTEIEAQKKQSDNFDNDIYPFFSLKDQEIIQVFEEVHPDKKSKSGWFIQQLKQIPLLRFIISKDKLTDILLEYDLDKFDRLLCYLLEETHNSFRKRVIILFQNLTRLFNSVKQNLTNDQEEVINYYKDKSPTRVKQVNNILDTKYNVQGHVLDAPFNTRPRSTQRSKFVGVSQYQGYRFKDKLDKSLETKPIFVKRKQLSEQRSQSTSNINRRFDNKASLMQSALREIQGLESKLRDLKFSERKALSSVSNLRQSSQVNRQNRFFDKCSFRSRPTTSLGRMTNRLLMQIKMIKRPSKQVKKKKCRKSEANLARLKYQKKIKSRLGKCACKYIHATRYPFKRVNIHMIRFNYHDRRVKKPWILTEEIIQPKLQPQDYENAYNKQKSKQPHYTFILNKNYTNQSEFYSYFILQKMQNVFTQRSLPTSKLSRRTYSDFKIKLTDAGGSKTPQLPKHHSDLQAIKARLKQREWFNVTKKQNKNHEDNSFKHFKLQKLRSSAEILYKTKNRFSPASPSPRKSYDSFMSSKSRIQKRQNQNNQVQQIDMILQYLNQISSRQNYDMLSQITSQHKQITDELKTISRIKYDQFREQRKRRREKFKFVELRMKDSYSAKQRKQIVNDNRKQIRKIDIISL